MKKHWDGSKFRCKRFEIMCIGCIFKTGKWKEMPGEERIYKIAETWACLDTDRVWPMLLNG